jgi:hypothetical protein
MIAILAPISCLAIIITAALIDLPWPAVHIIAFVLGFVFGAPAIRMLLNQLF